MVHSRFLFLSMTAVFCIQLAAQDAHGDGPVDLAKLGPEKRFEFLLGEWTYRFDNGHGETKYREVGKSGAIQEIILSSFFGDREFAAGSAFIYVPSQKMWLHNWVDTLGNILKGKGKMETYASTEKPAMVVVYTIQGQYFKHVWFNITKDRFDTDLYHSTDGENYNLVRQMPYIRKK